jgi:hypothetical protein
MERKGTGTKYVEANCEGRQSPPRAVELRKKKKKAEVADLWLQLHCGR